MPLISIALTRSSTKRVAIPRVVGLLHDGDHRLLGQPSWFEEARDVTALPELGDPQFDGAGLCFQVAIAVAVALREPIGALLAKVGACQPANLRIHQPMRGKADHLAQKVGIGSLSQQRLNVNRIPRPR